MRNARALRSEPIERAPDFLRAELGSIDDLGLPDLPASGSSPALDLQRRLSEAALRGFYPIEPVRQGMQRRNYAFAGAVAILVWGMVFGVGMALIG